MCIRDRVILYSTSSYDGQLKFDDSAYYVKKQLFATSLGFMAMYLISRIDYHVWMRFAGAAYIAAPVSYTHLDVYKRQRELRMSRRYVAFLAVAVSITCLVCACLLYTSHSTDQRLTLMRKTYLEKKTP